MTRFVRSVLYSWLLIERASCSLADVRRYLQNATTSSISPSIASNFASQTLDMDKESRCWESWASYYQKSISVLSMSASRIPKSLQTSIITNIYATVKTVGRGHLYTDCDLIPRFKLDPNGTTTVTSSITVTVTGRELLEGPGSKEIMEEILQEVWGEDQAKILCDPNPRFCDILWSTSFYPELRSATHGFNVYDDIFSGVNCPETSGCFLEMDAEVVLLYWPTTLTSRNICASNGYSAKMSPSAGGAFSKFTTDKITFAGQDLILKSFIESGVTRENPRNTLTTFNRPSVLNLKENFTFTSPTIYIAHRPITAISQYNLLVDMSTPPSAVTHVIDAGIFALDATDLFSVRPKDLNVGGGLQYAQLVAKGLFESMPHRPELPMDHVWEGEKMPFDFGHLIDPVPASVYYDARTDCWGKATHCGTITDGSYRPSLAIKRHVWASLMPKYSNCWRPGIVDPPIVLSPIRSSLTDEVRPHYNDPQNNYPQINVASPTPDVASEVSALEFDKTPLPGNAVAGATPLPTSIIPAVEGASFFSRKGDGRGPNKNSVPGAPVGLSTHEGSGTESGKRPLQGGPVNSAASLPAPIRQDAQNAAMQIFSSNICSVVFSFALSLYLTRLGHP